jgi:ADP-dependent NAD(P)H-hydrate dehydratase / NAD(P)H-hydrate epimerase
MNGFDTNDLKKLYVPASSSVKGDNGKLMVIAGSILFHAASLWPLEVASKIVDMVYFSSVDSNNKIVQKNKEMFQNGIIVPRQNLDNYIEEADCILIGPGLPRNEGLEDGDEGTKELTEKLLTKYPNKKWVIDGGSLQVINPEILPKNSIITPNKKEFELLKSKIQNSEFKTKLENLKIEEQAQIFAKEYTCVILLKGEVDYVSDGEGLVQTSGGNAGMTKGGTGDVLAGLVASLYCKNDAFLSAASASYINKTAGESLAQKSGIYFNATELAGEIPTVMKRLLIS